MKTYEAIFKPGKTKGVFGISLVENPAMEGHFLALSEDDAALTLKTVNEDEKVLIGLVLEPNKPIYRNQEGEEFNVVFSEETIKELAYAFYKEGFQKNSSLEHSEKIAGVTFVESWIVEDPANDKSNALGLSHPKGSWIATMKVDSPEVWENYVKTGKVKGFSVDALVSLRELNLKTNIEMSEKASNTIADAIENGFNRFLEMFKNKEKESLELGKVATENGEISVNYDGDTLEVDGRVWLVAEDGTEVALPAGEYPLEDKRVLVVKEDGKVAEIKEAPTEQPAPTEEKAPVEASQPESNESIANAIKSVLIKYGEEQDKKFEQLKTELKADFDKKLLEFGEQPAAKPKKAIPDQVNADTARGRILATIQEQQ